MTYKEMKTITVGNEKENYKFKVGTKFIHKKYGVCEVTKIYKYDYRYVVFKDIFGTEHKNHGGFNSGLYIPVIFIINEK